MDAIELIEWIKDNALFIDKGKLEVDDAEIFKAESLAKTGTRSNWEKFQKEFFIKTEAHYETKQSTN